MFGDVGVLREDGVSPNAIVEALAETGDYRAITPLKRLLSTTITDREHVARSLQKIQKEIELQTEWSQEQRQLYRVHRDVMKFRGEDFGDAEVRLAIKYLHSEPKAISKDCLTTLAIIGTREAVQVLLQELHSSERDRRIAAIKALAASGSRWPVPLLLALLKDDSLFIPSVFGLRTSIPADELDHELDQHEAHLVLLTTFENTICRSDSQVKSVCTLSV